MSKQFKRSLTIRDGIPLAFGSIMGSGILFLPSLSFSIAGKSVLWVWVVATLMCFPLLLIFRDMFYKVATQEGVSGYIKIAFGDYLGSSVSILFLATVSLGMPAASLIAGNYMAHCIGLGVIGAFVFSIIIPLIALFFNIFGVRIGSLSQTLVTIGLLGIAIALFSTTFPLISHPVAKFSMPSEVSPFLLAITSAFWAFAGFENLSFMAGEFKNPGFDLFVSAAVALVLCGLIYLGLAFSYAALIPPSQIDVTQGLLQLARFSTWPSIVEKFVGAFAFAAVLLNFNSWMWGISRMIYAEAAKGHLPKGLAVLSSAEAPKRALVLLAFIFCAVITCMSIFKTIVSPILIIVSADFVMIYILCALSYFVINKDLSKRLLATFIGGLLAAAVSQSGWSLCYPLLVLILSSFVYSRKSKKLSSL